jgi:HlyD family secretion protein
MRVANMSSMEVRVDVGENDIVKVSIGDSADVEVEAYNKRKFSGVVTQIAASTKTASLTSSNDVTNYEVHIRLDPAGYQDLLDPSRPKKFPFRPGMNASADIKTKRRDGVISVPIASVAARVKGTDTNIEDKKKQQLKNTDNSINTDDAQNTVAGDDLEEVVFIVTADNKIQKKVVTTGIQDINYIEVTSGLKDGEQIVTGPYNAVSKTLKTGDKVKIVTQEKLFEK